MSLMYKVDYERVAALDRALQEVAERLGFYIAGVVITDDRDSEWRPKVEIVLLQKEPE